jgi:hypothetical protein
MQAAQSLIRRTVTRHRTVMHRYEYASEQYLPLLNVLDMEYSALDAVAVYSWCQHSWKAIQVHLYMPKAAEFIDQMPYDAAIICLSARVHESKYDEFGGWLDDRDKFGCQSKLFPIRT